MEVSREGTLEGSSKDILEGSSKDIKVITREEILKKDKVETTEGREEPLILLVSEVNKERIMSFD